MLITGGAYNCRYALPSLAANLVLPNDADVFMLLSRYNRRRKAPFTEDRVPSDRIDDWIQKVKTQVVDESPLSDAEIDFIKEVFGDRLKVFLLLEEMPAYENYIMRQRDLMMHLINRFRKQSVELGLPPPFGGDVAFGDNGNVRIVIDQYHHVAECYRQMVKFEVASSVRYDSVIRIRPDFIVEKPAVLQSFYDRHRHIEALYVCGSFREDPMEWADEFCFFGERPIADKVFPNLDQMGFMEDRRYATVYKGNEYMFAPETQFSILLWKLEVPVVSLPIYRSSCYSDGKDGWDYLNYTIPLGG